ncbi:MAG: hypothetical protein ACRD4X_07395, partial [Candidatus Acidiferrales bacterium]
MITRREMMGGTMAAAFATLVAGSASTLLEAKTLPAPQHGNMHGMASPVQTLMDEPLPEMPNPEVSVITLTVAPGAV